MIKKKHLLILFAVLAGCVLSFIAGMAGTTETGYANCLMLMILWKQPKSGFRGDMVTDQILLKEEYVKKSENQK